MSISRLCFCLLIGFFALVAGPSLRAQTVRQQADVAYGSHAYDRAIPLYEKELAAPALTETQRRDVLLKLADSYRKTQDSQQAERVYRQLMTTPSALPADQHVAWLHYAQTLATNGKFKESAEAFETYQTQPEAPAKSLGFMPMVSDDPAALANDRGAYNVRFLPINTPKAEFSPMYYKDGLVYVSANGNHGRKLFSFGKSSFLDLRYLPDLTSIAPRDGKSVSNGGTRRRLGSDFYSDPTANDVKTIHFVSGDKLSSGEGYARRALNPADRFDKSLNTKYHEGPATFTHDGKRVYFTRNNFNNGEVRKSSDGVNKLKLYTAIQENGAWKAIEELPFNSDEYSVGHPALGRTRNGEFDQLLYFASDMPGGFGGTDIYVTRWTNGAWGRPMNLGKSVNSKGNELFPFADEKGNLYFSSDGLPGGKGELDVFYAAMNATGEGVSWVKNLPEPINSASDDFGIITDGNRKTGYFSSNRKHGGADDDLYAFTRQTEPLACRELIVQVYDAETNAPLPDVALTVADKDQSAPARQLKTDATGTVRFCIEADNDFLVTATETGFLTNRAGLSTRDLRDRQPIQIALPLTRPTIDMDTVTTTHVRTGAFAGHVKLQKTNAPIPGVTVMLQSRCDSTQLTTVTDETGAYSFPVNAGCADYLVRVQKAGYASFGGQITDTTTNGELTMFRKGDVIKIDNVFYDTNKFDIRPDATTELDKIVALMQEYPTMRIELRSHTDSRSSTKHNKTLSANRAKAAVAYLTQKGIAANRMKAAGFGESLPVNKCKDGIPCTETEYQQNRRTEIRVLTL